MPQSLSLVIVHLIFSTKDRCACLAESVRSSLYPYLATVARNTGCECYRVGGVADHVHIAVRLSRTITVAKLVEDLKTSSSKWLKTQQRELSGFAWQRGYGAFSIAPGDLESVIAYTSTSRRSITASVPFRRNTGTFSANAASSLMNAMCGIE